VATCEQCPTFLVLDPTDGHIAGKITPIPPMGGDTSGQLNLDPQGRMYVPVYSTSDLDVYDANGRLLAKHDLGAGQPTVIGRQAQWGDAYWPSPVFAKDGHGYTFNKDGLLELQVTLPGG
jgi:hypothetical protein